MIDLHCHLDGSLRYHTLHQLARQQGITIPTSPSEIFFYKGMNLNEALSRFAITLSVLQTPKSLCRVAREICEDADSSGVSRLELRFAPHLHTGAPIDKIVDAAIDGANGDASIILCGLYGDPPEIFDELVDLARTRKQVVGIDLAGAPMPTHKWGMFDYATQFTRAKRLGINRTVHAGEGRSAQEIAVAINFLHAQRIGHGLTVLEDQKVVDLVRERNIVLEACPTSNMHTGLINEIGDHPIKEWIRQEIPVAICSDNLLLSNTDLSVEFSHLMYENGLTEENVDLCEKTAFNALFKR